MTDSWWASTQSNTYNANDHNSWYSDFFAALWGEEQQYYVPRGWENYATTIKPKTDANVIHYQGTPALPITYYRWTDPTDTQNYVVEPEDPFQTEMFITYGPMLLFDVDRMTEAIALDIPLDDSYYYDAYWFSLNLKGTTVALREDDYVIQYMAIENPQAPGFYEQWSCLGQYKEESTTYHGTVFNYEYGNTLLTNEEVTRNADNVDYQTYYHPSATRDGAWTMGASTKYYTTYFNAGADVTGMTCTGVRRVGFGQKGYFGFEAGDYIRVNLGFRVYEDENDTIARLFKDYESFSMEVKGATTLVSTAIALIAASLAF